MSLSEVREIFDQQVERTIIKLQQSRKVNARRSPGKPAVDDEEDMKLRDLAVKMTESIMRKIIENGPAWSLEFDERRKTSMAEEPQDAPAQPAPNSVDAEGAADNIDEQTLAKLKSLEEKLDRKKAEEANFRTVLTDKLMERYSAVLESNEQNLLLISEQELLRSANPVPLDGTGDAQLEEEEEELARELVASRERLVARLAATKRLISDLQDSRQNLVALEQQQSTRRPNIEELLQRSSTGLPWDAEEVELLEAIRKAEVMGKRMRHDLGDLGHVSAAISS